MCQGPYPETVTSKLIPLIASPLSTKRCTVDIVKAIRWEVGEDTLYNLLCKELL